MTRGKPLPDDDDKPPRRNKPLPYPRDAPLQPRWWGETPDVDEIFLAGSIATADEIRIAREAKRLIDLAGGTLLQEVSNGH